MGPLILPSGVLAKPGRPGPNERLVIGHIGIGGMGTGHLNFVQGHNSFESGALCDVDQKHLDKAASIVGRKVPTYTDYRKLLEQKDLDAVIIAAPDHWHGLVSFPRDEGMEKVVSNFKEVTAKKAGISWQRRFFDHRLRNEESFDEKARYIRMNPVRKGLVATPEEWRWVWESRHGAPGGRSLPQTRSGGPSGPALPK